MPKVVFSYGLQSAYNGLGTPSEDTLYFITDTQRIYKGSTLIADATKLNVQFVTETPTPETTKDNVLYVSTVDGSTTMWVKNGESVSQVGGGEATEIADGVISFDKFAPGTVATDLNSPSATTIPTTEAVTNYVTQQLAGLDSAIVDVSAARSEDNSGTVLTFTPKSGEPKTVTVADLFLSAAKYDPESHILTLTVQGGTAVEVNLEELVPTTSTFSTVEVGTGNGFEVNLGSGVGLGGFSAGDEITEDMTLAEFAKKLLMKQVPPTYTQPTVSIARNGGTANGNVEIGTNVSVSLNATFTQNDAGTLTGIQFKKGSDNVGESSSTSPASYTESINSFDTAVSYSAVATYEQGSVKNDNLGQPYPTGQIPAGSKTSSSISYNPYRKGFYGAVSSKDGSIDSAFVRALPSSTSSAPAQGNTWSISIPVGTLRVAFAYPATLRDVNSVKDVNGLNAEIKSAFTKSTVSVEGANGYAGINYKVYVTDFANATDAANTYTVQI